MCLFLVTYIYGTTGDTYEGADRIRYDVDVKGSHGGQTLEQSCCSFEHTSVLDGKCLSDDLSVSTTRRSHLDDILTSK